ncbi:ABC transporter ATP-binding protein, partial [bacterium]|nr:ABC transporter ATP-binding protein [bacterium]
TESDAKNAKPEQNSSKKNVAAPNTLSKEEQRKRAAEQRKLTAPIRRDIEDTEKALVKLDNQLAELEIELADTGLYEDNRKADLLKLLDEQASKQQQHSDYEEHLLLAMTTLEDMEAQFS